jgi:hypothetical protein
MTTNVDTCPTWCTNDDATCGGQHVAEIAEVNATALDGLHAVRVIVERSDFDGDEAPTVTLHITGEHVDTCVSLRRLELKALREALATAEALRDRADREQLRAEIAALSSEEQDDVARFIGELVAARG